MVLLFALLLVLCELLGQLLQGLIQVPQQRRSTAAPPRAAPHRAAAPSSSAPPNPQHSDPSVHSPAIPSRPSEKRSKTLGPSPAVEKSPSLSVVQDSEAPP